MIDPLLRDAQDKRAADRFRSFTEDSDALRRLTQIPNDELAGLRETIKQAQLGLSLISSALDQIAQQRVSGSGADPTKAPDGGT